MTFGARHAFVSICPLHAEQAGSVALLAAGAAEARGCRRKRCAWTVSDVTRPGGVQMMNAVGSTAPTSSGLSADREPPDPDRPGVPAGPTGSLIAPACRQGRVGRHPAVWT